MGIYTLVERLVDKLQDVSDEERVEIIDIILNNFCRHCGNQQNERYICDCQGTDNQ